MNCYPVEFVEWLLDFSKDRGLQKKNSYKLKWIIEVETHIIEYMTTKQAYIYWRKKIGNNEQN